MAVLLTIPLAWRLTALAVLGACLGAVVNLAVDRLAWHRRNRSPWAPRPDGVPPRRWSDRLPIVGWLGLRREHAAHGRGHWLRPMLVEIGCGVGLPWLYWWEVAEAALLPLRLPPPVGLPALAMLHLMFLSHAVLGLLMLVASLIDIDEKTIPDAVTVPGTVVGLLAATLWPVGLLPAVVIPPGVNVPANFWRQVAMADWPWLHAAAPNPWPAWLAGAPAAGSLLLGLGVWWIGCLALLPRVWRPRHGWVRGFALLVARWRRQRETYALLAGAILGSAAIGAVWWRGGSTWRGLITALIGMAVGGAIVWAVRIVGTATLRREAMGFGDVTLMAMIGTFVGWQSCLMIFFLAPVAGLIVGLLQLIVSRETEIPYGPFLCLATLVVIVFWAPLWAWAWAIFALGWLLALILLACMALMGVMLAAWMAIRSALGF